MLCWGFSWFRWISMIPTWSRRISSLNMFPVCCSSWAFSLSISMTAKLMYSIPGRWSGGLRKCRVSSSRGRPSTLSDCFISMPSFLPFGPTECILSWCYPLTNLYKTKSVWLFSTFTNPQNITNTRSCLLYFQGGRNILPHTHPNATILSTHWSLTLW